jgi:hypothetical protein
MQIYETLLAMAWPREFLVEYTSGERELLLRGDGVAIIPPGDDPEGFGGLSATLPKKHPSNRKEIGRYVRFTELKGIFTTEGRKLWPVQ